MSTGKGSDFEMLEGEGILRGTKIKLTQGKTVIWDEKKSRRG